MNRSVCTLMVSVAGLAVPGMTATLAGAQARPAAFTLNDVVQAPFASYVLAAPTGAAVTHVVFSQDRKRWVYSSTQELMRHAGPSISFSWPNSQYEWIGLRPGQSS